MLNQFSRTALLVGQGAIEKLQASRVAIFGIGGVGGYVAEALARSGVGCFDLIDNDTVALTNLNRQIIATHDTIGQPKVQVMAERIHDINPEMEVTCFGQEINPSTFAIAKADMMIRGGNPDNMRFGDTLSEDKFAGYTFRYIISNEAVICGLTPEKARNFKEFAA